MIVLDLVKVDGPANDYTFKLDPESKFSVRLNVSSLSTKLTQPDYFPLNHTFFLEKPIYQMYQMGMDES